MDRWLPLESQRAFAKSSHYQKVDDVVIFQYLDQQNNTEWDTTYVGQSENVATWTDVIISINEDTVKFLSLNADIIEKMQMTELNIIRRTASDIFLRYDHYGSWNNDECMSTRQPCGMSSMEVDVYGLNLISR